MNHLIIRLRQDASNMWLAEVEQIPVLQAVAQNHATAIAEVQVLALRWLAEQIEIGIMKPTEFSMAVAQAEHSPGAAWQEAVSRFAESTALYARPETQRDGARRAVMTAHQLLHAMGIPSIIMSPLVNLTMALGDLEHGTVAPVLRPGKLHNKPLDPTVAWTIRAYIAAALETRILMNEALKPAAARVAHDAQARNILIAGAKREGVPNADRVIALRKDFRRPSGAVPRNGFHRNAWQSVTEQAAASARLAEPERSQSLRQLYETVLHLAAVLR